MFLLYVSVCPGRPDLGGDVSRSAGALGRDVACVQPDFLFAGPLILPLRFRSKARSPVKRPVGACLCGAVYHRHLPAVQRLRGLFHSRHGFGFSAWPGGRVVYIFQIGRASCRERV